MKNRKKHIAIVYEGEKTEKALLEKMQEVFLFFDYDAHNDNVPKVYRNKDIVNELLNAFHNETENGKLYISYPMIESMREISSGDEKYRSFYVSVDNLENYKQYVSEELEFQNFHHLTRKQWEVACRASVKRAHLIVNFKDKIPTYNYFLKELTQQKIYKAQLKNFILLNKMVGVVNSVPLFLLEYFDEDFWNQIMQKA